MTQLAYVAEEIRKHLQRYDHKRDGSYAVYMAKVAIAAHKEAQAMNLPER